MMLWARRGVVASNLALAGHSVMLIEAGRDARDDLSTTIAALSYPSTAALRWHFFVQHFGDDQEQELQNNHLTWTLPNGSYWVGSGARAPKDAKLNGVYYPRGATLGGSAIVNAMGTFLPNDADWDYVADITGDESWSLDRSGNMRTIFEKVEKNHYLPRGTRGHGFDGFMDTRLGSPDYYKRSPGALSFLGSLASALLGRSDSPIGGKELLPLLGKDPNFESPRRDFSTGSFGLPIHTTEHGKRWTPRDLIMSTLNAKKEDGSSRYRLKLQLESLATRVHFDDDGRDHKPRAVGVEFLEGAMVYAASWNHDAENPPAATLKRAYACREVIVSGGAFNSPQLLQLSGIGDRQHLSSLGIPVVAHVPGVGQNLQDNQELPVVGHGPANFTTAPDPAAANCTFGLPDDPCVAAWRRGEGPYAGPQGNSECALLRTQHSPDGGRRRDILTFSPPTTFRGFWPPTNQTDPGLFTDPPTAVSRSMVRMSPRPPSDKAGVRITSRDPTSPPAINFEHFPGGLDDADVGAMLDTVAFVRRVFAAVPAPFGPVTPVEPPCPAGVLSNGYCRVREQDAAWVRAQAFGHHATGTCRIGAGDFDDEEDGEDPLAVLDSRFRVRGVRGLRVVDASVFPRQPGAFPVLATVMVGQKASEVILEDA
ncbi:hypothetical protein PG985_014055 [Apiospora marii]|uniref:uncharacterized protein n=1 Tax=Apiospora marii TaxID=335849 RepID=UPI0031307723